MRVKIEGPCNVQRLEKCLQVALRHFATSNKDQDLPTMHGVNLYFTIRDQNGNQIELTDDKGNIMEMLFFKDPNRIQRKARKAQVLSLVQPKENDQQNGEEQ